MKLSKKLIDNAPWFIAAEAIILLLALFMPIMTTTVLGTTVSMSLFDVVTGADVATGSSIPWMFVIGLVGFSLVTTFFGKSKKSDVNSALPYLVITVVGAVLMLAFALFLGWGWMRADLIAGGLSPEEADAAKAFLSVGLGVWIPTVLAMGVAGLAIYTYTEEK